MKKISIPNFFKLRPNYKSAPSKEDAAYLFLIDFRKYLLENNLADFGDIIPSKKELANFLNISTGTVANAIKRAEDGGFFISKQCVGTMIKNENEETPHLKSVSKKDRAACEIKKFLIREKYEENEFIPGVIALSSELKTSPNTVRLAVAELIAENILRKEIYNKKPVLILNSKEKLAEFKEKQGIQEIKNKNLAKILKENIKKYILQNFKPQEKIPTNKYFAKMYNVSIRTVNSAFLELNKEKFILSRRGKYGSIFLGAKIFEKSIFETKKSGKKITRHTFNYKWEAAFDSIKKFILKNYEAGDKIPSMKELAKRLNVSVSTVRKAAGELIKQGILFAQRGKYGGLFIMEMPQKEDAYQWVAINPEYFK